MPAGEGLGVTDQLVPSHDSTRVEYVPLKTSPTATHQLDPVQLIPLSSLDRLPLPFATMGEVCGAGPEGPRTPDGAPTAALATPVMLTRLAIASMTTAPTAASPFGDGSRPEPAESMPHCRPGAPLLLGPKALGPLRGRDGANGAQVASCSPLSPIPVFSVCCDGPFASTTRRHTTSTAPPATSTPPPRKAGAGCLR